MPAAADGPRWATWSILCACRLIAFTSKHAGATYFGDRRIGFGLQPQRIGDSEVHVLPSPSGLARSHWNLAPWQALEQRYRTLRG